MDTVYTIRFDIDVWSVLNPEGWVVATFDVLREAYEYANALNTIILNMEGST